MNIVIPDKLLLTPQDRQKLENYADIAIYFQIINYSQVFTYSHFKYDKTRIHIK